MNQAALKILYNWQKFLADRGKNIYPVVVLDDICQGHAGKIPDSSIKMALFWLDGRKDPDRSVVRGVVKKQLEGIRWAG